MRSRVVLALGSYTLGALSGVVGYMGYHSSQNKPDSDSEWRIPVIRSRSDGNTYIDYDTYTLQSCGDIGKLAEVPSVRGMKLRQTSGDYCYQWHCAPNKQFVVNLDSGVTMETSDGDIITVPKGHVFALEDTCGKGHRSWAVNGQPRRSVFIPYSENE